MAANDERRIHQEWLGYVQPIGLVVAPAALVTAGVYPDIGAAARQASLDALAATDDTGERTVDDFLRLARELFEWQPGDLVPADELPETLVIPLPEYGESLRPTWAIPDPDAADRSTAAGWLLLVQQLLPGTDLDAVPESPTHVGVGAHGLWRASPQARFERLLRESGVQVGVIVNSHALRLVYAPRGESSGHLTFRWTELLTAAGRPMLAALHMLLSAERLFSVPPERRLGALLRSSRRFQNEVSTDLAEQVLGALYELTYGFQAADELRGGALLRDALRQDPQHVYGGLLTTLLRLVFICYAEDRGLLPADELYQRNYSVGGLFERLREDAARHPDTMNQRYGAWGQLLALFRMLHDGARCGTLYLPPRHGRLFDPDAYPFLEGRPWGTRRVMGEPIDPPKVSDGCIWRVLQRLLVLDGERLSYRALDVEQIGSVYEAIMGFELVVVRGTAVSVIPKAKKPGSPSHPVVDLDALLALSGGKRKDALKEWADCELPAGQMKSLAEATTTEGLLAALGRKVSPFTPRPVPRGAMLLQPTEERRRSGSHYTPRALTEPIVRTTLTPVLEALGPNPRPAQILALRVCDPAMGSGAFLVETCRFLGDTLVEAWQRHGETPELPPDEDAQLAARRLVAQRCLYGVDRNPFAADLAKLSLWLVTLAREHPFTFVDHALRCGDSLVGFSRSQLGAFQWERTPKLSLTSEFVAQQLEEVEKLRFAIEAMGDTDDVRAKARLLRDADDALRDVRLIGDALAAAFFAADKPKAREKKRAEMQDLVEGWLGGTRDRGLVAELVEELRQGEWPVVPFHWEIEFPEVFDRKNPGFDAFVGNPPFLGGTRISSELGRTYLAYLVDCTPGATGNVDLAAFFLRRSDALLRVGGAMGMISTNSIRAGDSGRASLSLFRASRREFLAEPEERQWPGASANVAYVPVCIQKLQAELNDASTPQPLAQNRGLCNRGCDVFGAGFVLSEQEASEIRSKDPASGAVIQPYIGGEEFNASPTLHHERLIINFGEIRLEEAQRYAAAFARVERLVRPARATVQQTDRRELWWLYATRAPAVVRYLSRHERVLAIAQISKHLAFAFLPKGAVFSNTLLLFLDDRYAFFCVLQSRMHFEWVMRWAGAMRQDVRYTSTDCFETFPFPKGWETHPALESAGKAYYEFRAELMVMNHEGLTKTYNRFHDPDERDAAILRLRELHDELDRAVLAAYGWMDLEPRCEFLLDYEDESETDDDGRARRKRKPWRYRWPDRIRDEVLARLLELNRRRAAGLPDRDEQKETGVHLRTGANVSERPAGLRSGQ